MSVITDKGLEVSHSEARASAADLVPESSEVLIHGPEFKLHLTLIDQSFDNLYPRLALRFRKRDDETPAVVEALMTEALRRVIRQVPWVASRIVPRPSASLLRQVLQVAWRAIRASVGLRLQPTEETTVYDVSSGPLHLGVAHLTDIGPGGGSVESLDDGQLPHTLWNIVLGAGCAMQLNFAPGNLVILSISIHHALADAHTLITIVKLLAQQMRELQGDPDDIKPTHAIRPLPAALDRSRLMRRKPVKRNVVVPDAIDSKTYSLTEFLFFLHKALGLRNLEPPVHGLVRIPTESFKSFKVALGHPADARLRITYHDFVCGLLFRGIIASRRRAGLVPGGDDTIVTLIQPVNIRRRWDEAGVPEEEPALGSEYMGNGLVFIRAALPLSELLGGDSAEAGIMAAALAMRRAIQAVHKGAIDDVLDMFATAPDPRLVRPSILVDMKSTAMMLTSWHGFPLHEIGWGPALSYQGMGQPRVHAWDGFFFMLPAESSGCCTMVVNLDRKAMDHLRTDIAWVRYSRWM